MTSNPEVHEAIAAVAELGEGPTWDACQGRLLWVDILGSRIHSLDPLSGSAESIPVGQHVGAAKPRTGGGMVVNMRDGIGLYDAKGRFSWLHYSPVPGRRGNDAAVAPDGALWAGTMRYDEARGGGTLSRIAPDGRSSLVLNDVTVSNGIGWSPNGRRMFYVDSVTRRIDTFEYAEGKISQRSCWVEIEPGGGFPDGLTVDADGAVWVALWDGGAVRRYTPNGRLDRIIELPVRRPTACAFGGAGLSDLYVTTARTGLSRPGAHDGSLLVVPNAGQGAPQPAFAG